MKKSALILLIFCVTYAASDTSYDMDEERILCGNKLSTALKFVCSSDTMRKILTETSKESLNKSTISRIIECCTKKCRLRDLLPFCPQGNGFASV
ncbi:unnamed protein product [Chironomus riparius]|uniref:Insulin-like domain-containing protein n=1 Tax=Chironomus riparius TaxID=315576 RepID=A0A9N9WX31_9DIPT|nr:unnamed protein product [Chironomus riparius]